MRTDETTAGHSGSAGVSRNGGKSIEAEPSYADGRAREVVARFAPSPTGRMHAGNIFSALVSWLVAKEQGGSVVLRIEDLDEQRSKPLFADQVMRDFESLGLTWDRGPYFQHDRYEAYARAFDELQSKGLVYPCFCTRADLHASSAPHRGDKPVYAGTCKNLSEAEIARRLDARAPSFRLQVPHAAYAVRDEIAGTYSQVLDEECGDFVIRRADGMYAYQLAVVVDDANQGVNCVVRGRDLLDSSPQQRYLQELLGYEPCSYVHVPLIVGEPGRRLSKRDKDAGIVELLDRFGSPEGIIGHIAFIAGFLDCDEPLSCDELLDALTLDYLIQRLTGKEEILWT